jgi:hypothetical protein
MTKEEYFIQFFEVGKLYCFKQYPEDIFFALSPPEKICSMYQDYYKLIILIKNRKSYLDFGEESLSFLMPDYIFSKIE